MDVFWYLLVWTLPNAILVIAVARILTRAGFSGWYALLTFVPLVSLVGLYCFAFGPWPAEDARRKPIEADSDAWSEAEEQSFKSRLRKQPTAP